MSDDEFGVASESRDDDDDGSGTLAADSSYGGSSSTLGSGMTETETEDADDGALQFPFSHFFSCPLFLCRVRCWTPRLITISIQRLSTWLRELHT
jgi:hypothetical protein